MSIHTLAQPDLLNGCAQEPIHIPGSIQPFGVLLTLEPVSLRVRNASANCAALLGVPATAALGRPLPDFLTPEDVIALQQYLATVTNEEPGAVVVEPLRSGSGEGGRWRLQAHQHQGVLFLEAEPADASASSPMDVSLRLRDAIVTLQHARGLQALCDTAVQQMQRITGFDRVMVYRFDRDWHGVVLAEACSPGTPSYLGHHFPASDIPAQARAVFLQNWLRMIPDARYTPCPIIPGRHPETGAPLDLGKAMLRSVSPIHLEYLANMGVAASLTVSLIDRGELWGLIACHHATPLLPGPDTRTAAQLIGQLMSAQLHLKEAQEDEQYGAHINHVATALQERMEGEGDLVQALVAPDPSVADLVSAHACGAAICFGGNWTTIGRTPLPAALDRLVSWLQEEHPQAFLFHTDRLPHLFPEASAYSDVASGLCAVSLARTKSDYILWFRPEAATTVTWAGAPEKSVRSDDGQLSLHPRASFEAWTEVVRGTAPPWKRVELEALARFRNAVIAAALQREYRREQAARQHAERVSREKDEMVMMVSHDLRTPLTVAAMSFEFLHRAGLSNEPAVQRMVERGMRATNTMEKLISNILDVAKIEAGTMVLKLKAEYATDLVNQVLDDLRPVAEQKGVRLQARLEDAQGYKVFCERARIYQVLTNLVNNAVKFTKPGGGITLSLEADEDAVVFGVADTGEGIPAENLPKIFDRFWQAEETNRLGTGLGLWIAKGIVERHQGRIWVESQLGLGTRFYFTLPRAR
jgi:light-regulated signal transduction histidine kinase (bacteriophytochrome)